LRERRPEEIVRVGGDRETRESPDDEAAALHVVL
jgi:hypothetical protein